MITIHEDAIFQGPADGAGEHPALDLPSETDEVFHGVAVGNVGDVLMNYGSGVEVLGT